jgi:hypothetical protein
LWFTVSYQRKSVFICGFASGVFVSIRGPFLRSLRSSAFAKPTARQVFAAIPDFAFCHLSFVMRFASFAQRDNWVNSHGAQGR